MAMLVCMTATLFSCSKDEEELSIESGIVGIWEVSSVEILVDGKSEDTFVKEMVEITNLSKAEIMELYDLGDDESEGNIEFRKDKKYFTEDEEGGYDERGTWRSGENKALILDLETYSVEFTVKSLKSNAAILSIVRTQNEEIEGKEYNVEMEQLIYLKK